MSGDPYFDKVALLMHMDGSNNGTTFTDNSPNRFTVTASGTAKISTAESKFGGASTYFDGSGARLYVPPSPAFGFGIGDFTVEFWLNYKGGNGYVFFIQTYVPGTNYLGYGLQIGTKLPWIWSDGDVLVGNTAITNDVWQHHAVVRKNGVLTIYLDGVSIGQTTWGVDLEVSKPFYVGANPSGTQATLGYIDELRVCKGVATYTADFTPPDAPFPDYMDLRGLPNRVSQRTSSTINRIHYQRL